MSKNKDVAITKNNLISFLSELFLFKEFSEEDIEIILEKYEFQLFEFECDEKIYSPDDFSKKIGFVFDGECVVEKQRYDGNSVPLNVLKKRDSFGILSVFSDSDRFPTCVRAKKKTSVIFIDAESLLTLVKKYPEIALAVIRFTCNRIEFLNSKVATFSADSVEEKLAFYILQQCKEKGTESIIINLSKTAKTLNAGRASIYRALNALKSMKIIEFENKNIHILDLKGLERITQ